MKNFKSNYSINKYFFVIFFVCLYIMIINPSSYSNTSNQELLYVEPETQKEVDTSSYLNTSNQNLLYTESQTQKEASTTPYNNTSVQRQLYMKPKVQEDLNNTYNPNRPEWSEFCPMEYLNAEYNNKWLVPYYKQINKWENNYWVNRKKQFDMDVAKCDLIPQPDLKDRCYAKLRNIQYSQNENFQKSKNVKLQERSVQDALMYGFFMNTMPQNVNLKIDGNMNHNVNYRYW